jgi:hypothetical protein
MAIDPRLYEKYSGRSGDPRERLGMALASAAEHKAKVRAAKERTPYEWHLRAKFQWYMFRIGVGAAALLIILLIRAVAG